MQQVNTSSSYPHRPNTNFPPTFSSLGTQISFPEFPTRSRFTSSYPSETTRSIQHPPRLLSRQNVAVSALSFRRCDINYSFKPSPPPPSLFGRASVLSCDLLRLKHATFSDGRTKARSLARSLALFIWTAVEGFPTTPAAGTALKRECSRWRSCGSDHLLRPLVVSGDEHEASLVRQLLPALLLLQHRSRLAGFSPLLA